MSVTTSRYLTPDDATALTRLVERSARVDETFALNEQQVLEIRRYADAHALPKVADAHELPVYVIARDMQQHPIGVGIVGGVVVDPSHRRIGIGTQILSMLLDLVDGSFSVWAHGDGEAARHLANQFGFTPTRELWTMRRALDEPPAEPTWPAGVTVRAFEPGRDEEAWLRVNAEAFAHHPEQGRLSRRDLDERMAEPWFNPCGFFLAERDGEVAGFHWTKVHREGAEPVGEIYVLGIARAAQGGGLGKALTLQGLRYLRDVGMPAVMLYVEADNPAAVGLYDRSGFTHTGTDVLYTAPTERRRSK